MDVPADPNSTVLALTGAELDDQGSYYSQTYGGHQFGSWAGQLGDGRVIALGQVSVRPEFQQTSAAETWEVHLKGAGKTPFSRHADGKAVLRSSIREFIGGEALQSLGVASTRCLSVALTGDEVMRDMFYDGRPEYERGAIVCRTAPSFIRFGTFELFASRSMPETLYQLFDYVERHYLHMPELIDKSRVERARHLVLESCRLNGLMLAQWQALGFTHGVLNTDNMSILGLTLDLGPYAFLDVFDPAMTPNASDSGRRYSFARQTEIGVWNCGVLGHIVGMALAEVPWAKEAAEACADAFFDEYRRLMARKLGFHAPVPELDDLVTSLYSLMRQNRLDYTNTFHRLVLLHGLPLPSGVPGRAIADLLKLPDHVDPDPWVDWVGRYRRAIDTSQLPSAQSIMIETNPALIPRQHLMHQAILDVDQSNDPKRLHALHQAVLHPYLPPRELLDSGDEKFSQALEALRAFEQAFGHGYDQDPPAWATQRGVGVLSCSS
eukprot:c12118_g1_i1.p1 GENE.c12118_g1_i1~~c12118_g1_i1.p1  ORF type:complete len:494 (+),score=78.63 c12118_g1_i1:317-1798(+)